MATFASGKFPALTVKFSNREIVKFANGEAEVDGDLADRLTEFADAHPEYQIEVVDSGEERLTPKQRVQQQARELGLDDSGTQREIEDRIEEALADEEPDEDDDDSEES